MVEMLDQCSTVESSGIAQKRARIRYRGFADPEATRKFSNDKHLGCSRHTHIRISSVCDKSNGTL